MIIKQRKIKSVQKYLSSLPDNQEFSIAVELTGNEKKAKTVGFSANLSEGEVLVPKPLGRVSSFNADGRYTPRKDLPKEKRYITTVSWTWKQWAGRGQTKTVTEEKDIYRDCYPQEFSPPPSVSLEIKSIKGKKFICSSAIQNNAHNYGYIKHAINLFLEIFGNCFLIDNNSDFLITPSKTLNWQLLPPGKHPFNHIKDHLDKVLETKNHRYSSVIIRRQEFIFSFNPDETYKGHGGYREYIAYVFKKKKIVVLESIHFGNAIYIFGDNWENVAKLTKAEILQSSLHKARIIHSNGWEDKLKEVVGLQ